MTRYKKYKEGQVSSESGQALMASVIFLTFILLAVIGGLALSATKGSQISLGLISSKKSYFLAEAGVEDIIHRVITAKNYSSEEIIELDGFFATTTIQDVASDIYIDSSASLRENVRKTFVSLTTSSDEISFYYGVQIGNGGIVMKNNSFVVGNIYSNGSVKSYNNNYTYGDIVSAGPAGLVNGVDTSGTVYAHQIVNSSIDGDAYYQTISGSVVGGTLYPGSPDQSLADLPIGDDMIDQWKNSASASVISSPCPYQIMGNSNVTLGPVKIECDLHIGDNAQVTLEGYVWVEGNIEIDNNATIRTASSFGANSVGIIADNPSNRLTSSKILLENNAVFHGSGHDDSYVLVVSNNKSSENGGGILAVDVKNNAMGDLLLYASHGAISLSGGVSLREVTAHNIILKNNVNVIYETGLVSLLFSSGPGGGMSINSWLEVE